MKYDVLYLDPAWRYNDQKGNDPKLGGITYSTMSNEEIASLPVYKVAKENAFVFCWATCPKIQEALDAIKGWGFKFINIPWIWCKLNKSGNGIYSGLGHYTAGNAELLLMGRRGSAPINRKTKLLKQIQEIEEPLIVKQPIGRHSAKPKIFRDLIRELFGPERSYLELFARDCGEGWSATGFDYDGVDIRDFLSPRKDLGEDMTGKVCSECTDGSYVEKYFFDDMDGVLHCDKCNHKVERYELQ